MNQFLSTFTSKVFSYVSDITQIKECTTIGLCYMCCHIHVRVKPGSQIFLCRVYGDYINTANPNTRTDTFSSCLLVPITKNSVLSAFGIDLSLIIHERISAMQFSIASSTSASLCSPLMDEMSSIIEYRLHMNVQTTSEIYFLKIRISILSNGF